MASNQTLKDLQWLIQSIQTETLNLKSISFHLSQPTSCCHQETQDSIHIIISTDSHFQFSNIVTLLSTSSKAQNLLQNLEFYQVEWQLEEMKSLEALLEGSSSVNQLAFKTNRLNADCMTDLSKILRKNESINEIILSESRIGSFGATLIASALKVNSCLTELQIWEDSIGSKGAEELSKMIEANSTLKLLTIFYSSSITTTPLISAVLARNRSTEVHLWSRESHNRNNTSKVVEFAPESSTLRIYRLTTSGACRVAGALGWNTTVKVKTLKDEDTKFSIWKLGGQHEFFSLHDLMFPGHGSASCFVIVSSLFRKPNNKEPKTPSELEEDLQYWVRFIVSNSRTAAQQCMLPNVTMVLTHYDKVNCKVKNLVKKEITFLVPNHNELNKQKSKKNLFPYLIPV